ncbi:class IIb bacteriocin, lactobin A/cerein 7B family [Pantoea sp. FN0307]|uniref:class IIb bacteriocin, lactobin A/cerein 7B family n=1 Tax=unclassified Pantoea TaxID=2630326 RepID=UPI003CE7474F
MRQLNDKEMEQISGGLLGVFDKIGLNIGAAIGSIVDKGTALGGLVTNATEAGTLLGSGIGKLLDLNITGAITDIGNGVVSIVDNGLSAIKQLFGKK